MADPTPKTCGAKITLDEAHDNVELDCDMEPNHYGPLHYDIPTGMGWGDPELPLPPAE